MTNENDMNPEMDWVTQDVVRERVGIDQWRCNDGKCTTSWITSMRGQAYYSMHGDKRIGSETTIELRCRRKDHPVLGKAGSRMISQDELNAAPKTRAWTFGKPAQTGHFLLSYKDPAIYPQEIFANTISTNWDTPAIWFIYLGQTSDFADPVVPKAKYTLLIDPKEPRSEWRRKPENVLHLLNLGWTIIKEQEYEIPEWDR